MLTLNNIIDQTFMAMIVPLHESSSSSFYASSPCLQPLKKTTYANVFMTSDTSTKSFIQTLSHFILFIYYYTSNSFFFFLIFILVV